MATEGSGARAGTFALRTADVEAGRPALRAMRLEAELFEASAMKAVTTKDLMEMKVVELKEELSARGEVRLGKQGVAASAAACGDRARPPRGAGCGGGVRILSP